MGESRTLNKNTITPLEYLDKLCDYALALGMSYNDYWFNHYDMINHYINAEKIRQRQRNMEMWLQGAYVYHAIGNLVPVLNPFSKDHKPKPYPKEPFPISQEDVDALEERRKQRIFKYMMSRVKNKEVSKK